MFSCIFLPLNDFIGLVGRAPCVFDGLQAAGLEVRHSFRGVSEPGSDPCPVKKCSSEIREHEVAIIRRQRGPVVNIQKNVCAGKAQRFCWFLGCPGELRIEPRKGPLGTNGNQEQWMSNLLN
jgi:hypothetical protein